MGEIDIDLDDTNEVYKEVVKEPKPQKSRKKDVTSVNLENNSNDMPNFDMDTMLKMKSIIDNMNRSQNDPRANLLKSLKPYLKPSRKDKVDQYIKLFSMGKAFEILNPLGGEKKNDV